MTIKRVKQELSVAQKLTAGILEKAATLKNDESILLHIRGFRRLCSYTSTVSQKLLPEVYEIQINEETLVQPCMIELLKNSAQE